MHIVGAEQLRGALLRVWPARPLSDEEQASEGRRGSARDKGRVGLRGPPGE